MRLGSGIFAVLLAAGLCNPAQAQTAHFAAYTQCRFGDDLALVEAIAVPDGALGRVVKTVMGPKRVPLSIGVTLKYGYPGTQPLANVKVEQIPAGDYVQAKRDLIANFNQILNADDASTRNYALKPRLNGLEIYGLDRNQLEGNVLGMYLFFADRNHTATTVYFLNQEPSLRKFDSLEGYAKLRDAFLESYTACVSGHARPAGEHEVAARTPLVEAEPPALPAVATATPTTALPDAPLPQGAAAAEAAKEAAAAAPVPATRSKPAVVKTKASAKTKPSAKKKASAKKLPAKAAHASAKQPGAGSSSKKPAPAKKRKKAD